VVILDASPAQAYAAKHIPGAFNYDIFIYGAKELPLTEIEKRYQSWGISPGKKIVIYDQGGSFLATRLFFSLEYYGFPTKNLFILDGGLLVWHEAGLPVTSEPTPSPKKGSFTIKRLTRDAKADLPEFLAASGILKIMCYWKRLILTGILEHSISLTGQGTYPMPSCSRQQTFTTRIRLSNPLKN